jgi:hypothetical protein
MAVTLERRPPQDPFGLFLNHHFIPNLTLPRISGNFLSPATGHDSQISWAANNPAF